VAGNEGVPGAVGVFGEGEVVAIGFEDASGIIGLDLEREADDVEGARAEVLDGVAGGFGECGFLCRGGEEGCG